MTSSNKISFKALLLLLSVATFVFPKTSCALVYVNRVFKGSNNGVCEYDIEPFNVVGSANWDASYQNAYGTCEGLMPGPPFIIEMPVTVRFGDLSISGGLVNVGARIDVDSGRTLSINNAQMQFANGIWLDVNNGAILDVSGTDVSTSSNTHIFRFFTGGVGRFSNCNMQTAAANMIYAFVPDELSLDNCVLTGGAPTTTPFALIFLTGNFITRSFTLTDCEFNAILSPNEQDYVDLASLDTVNISRNTFNATKGFGLDLDNIDELSLDDNNFQGVQCLGGTIIPTCGPVQISNCNIKSMRRNRGTGNTFNGIRLFGAGASSAAGTGRIGSEPGFPIVLQAALQIEAGDSLIIEPGTVMKLGGGDNFLVNGHLDARGATFTSQRDTSIDGNTTTLTGPGPADWRGIYINGQGGLTASGRFVNCTFRYGGKVDRSLQRGPNSNLTVDSCLFEHGDGNGIYLFDANANEPNTFARITNSTLRYFEKGIGDWQLFGNKYTFIKGNRIYANEVGLEIRTSSTVNIEANLIAGNRVDGINYTGFESPFIANNILVGNGRDGLYYRTGQGGDSSRLVNNHIIGNHRDGLGFYNFASFQVKLYNNLLAYNGNYGVGEYNTFLVDNPVRNNAFWTNGSGPFYDNNSNALDGSTLNSLDSSANNIRVDPLLTRLDSGQVDSVVQLSGSFQTEIFFRGAAPTANTWANKVLWNRSNDHFFYILSNDSASVRISDTTSTFPANSSFVVVDLDSLADASPLYNRGSNQAFLTAEDYLGNPRIFMDTVDIGAIEIRRDTSNSNPNTGLAEQLDIEFKVYPNPFSAVFFLQGNFAQKEHATLILYSLSGRQLWKRNWTDRIDLEDLPSGRYWLILNTEGKWAKCMIEKSP